jgi:hypothetical protein
MAKRFHPNKAKSGLWLPQEDDKHDLSMLRAAEKFFIEDLAQAEAYLEKIKKFANSKLTPSKKGFSNMIEIAEKDVEISKKNLILVKKLIKEAS